MKHTAHHTNGRGNRSGAQGSRWRPAWTVILLAALLLTSCGSTPRQQSVRQSVKAVAKAAVASARGRARKAPSGPATGSPSVAPSASGAAENAPILPVRDSQPATVPAQSGQVAPAVAATSGTVSLVDVPILGSELVPGWNTLGSWNVQFGKTQDPAPAGAPTGASVWSAAFGLDTGGVFFAVTQDSPRRYLAANYLAARLWINPGALDLPADHLFLAVLSSDRHSYWLLDDQAVPPKDSRTASESMLSLPGGVLPSNTWTEVQVWFRRMPSPPHGRYLTGVYLRAAGLTGQAIKVAGLELLAIPDNIQPMPLKASIVDLSSFRVSFNEDVDAVTAENPGNYRITSAADPAYSSPRAPSSVQYQPDTMSAVLTVPQPMQLGAEYTVEIRGITDFAPEPHVQAVPAQFALSASGLVVQVDTAHPSHPISPLIYGIAGGSTDYIKALRPTVENWGGNPSSRYNWQLGNAWNAASDWEYRNGDYGYKGQSASDDFVADAQSAGAEVRMTLPTLGWVAKNADNNTCSFPGPDGKCTNPQATCLKPGPVADPNRANVPTDVNWVVQWVKHMLVEKGMKIRFFAMDNEPELWGYTHYDVHPKCTTYDEILSTYLKYATAVRAVAPQAELLGPVSCCWYFYWNSAAGDADKTGHGGVDFLPWFLDQVRQHDEKTGVRTLDALDIHYYPEKVYNDNVDADTAPLRLQATRSLWDKTYADQSWIAQPINLINRMKQLIADKYPGTKLFISEWNFGADKTMNGALALADVLGILGQEDVYAASYWRSPELNSPGFFAFKMYTNYDDQGSRFGDTALPVTSSDRDQVAAYASRDSRTGNTTLMLINKVPSRPIPVTLQMDGMAGSQVALFRLSQDHPDGISQESFTLPGNSTITLPPYSITLLVLPH